MGIAQNKKKTFQKIFVFCVDFFRVDIPPVMID